MASMKVVEVNGAVGSASTSRAEPNLGLAKYEQRVMMCTRYLVRILRGYVRLGMLVRGVFLVGIPKLPKRRVPVFSSTELSALSGTGIEVVPNLPKRPVPVSKSYRTLPECSVGC